MSTIELLKLLLDKDLRSDIKDIIEKFKKSPEWKSDLITLKQKFGFDDIVSVETFIDFVLKLLKEKEWKDEEIEKIKFVFHELKNNAYKHAYRFMKLKVNIIVKLSSKSISIKLRDNGKGFDLNFVLADQLSYPKGLTYSKRASSDLYQIDKNTIVATFIKDEGKVNTNLTDIANVIQLKGKVTLLITEVIKQKIINTIDKIKGKHVLIDIGEVEYMDSAGLSLFHYFRRYYKMTKEIVYITSKGSSLFGLLKIMALDKVYIFKESYEEALKYWNYSEKEIDEILKHIQKTQLI